MARRVRELTDLVIDEVSLVDKGANQYATVTIAKRDTGEGEMDNYYTEDGELVDLSTLEDGDVVYDEDGEAFQYTDEDYEDDELEDEEVGKAALGRAFSSGARAGIHGKNPMNAGRVAFGRARAQGNPVVSQRTALGLAAGGGIAGTAGQAAGINAYRKRRAGVEKVYSAEEISKALSEAITDSDRDDIISKAMGQMEYLEEIAKRAEEAAESERQMRLDREYTEVAKSYDVGVSPEVLGPVLKRMAETLSYEDCEVVAKALDSASVVREMFEDLGSAGLGSNSDVLTQVDQIIDGYVAKSGNGETREQLVAKTFEMNPEAYDDYLRERRY